MERNWDLIREVLVEVEALNPTRNQSITYGPLLKKVDSAKDVEAIRLWKAGFITGVDAGTSDGGDEVIAQELTWAGLDLLDTIRSKAVWERVKTVAKQKGIELTFDSVKAIGKFVLASLLEN